MADSNTSQAQHITELDFDISGIPKQLKDIEKYVEESGKNIRASLDKSLVANLSTNNLINVKDVNEAIRGVQRQLTPLELFNVDDITYQIRNVERITDSQAKRLAANVMADQEKAASLARRERIRSNEEAIRDSQKLVNEQRRNAASLRYEQQKNAAKVQALAEASNLRIAEHQVKSQKTADAKILVEEKKRLEKEYLLNKQHADQIEMEQIRSAAKIAEEQLKQLNRVDLAKYKASLAPKKETSMFGDIWDKAETVLQIQGMQAAEEGLKRTIEVLKQTEFSVMEITRVLNEANLNVEQFTESLYNIGTEYGRQFEDAADVTLRFAQAGYNANDSLKMTETTMLALNTAELNAEQATNSLIGIMQQWNFTAKDYALIVDKINKTADSYAITSQDLVDGLLKSSSVAKNAGISFDNLIGILTTLKTTSGEAGKAVGNAFRSVVSYIQRPKSLAGFEEMGIKVFADEARTQLLPMMEILENMSNKWHEMSVEQQEYFMNSNTGLTEALDANQEYAKSVEEANKLEEEGAEIEKINQSNLAAGNLRRNYYISLMENFSKVQGVVNNLEDAEGYSLRENAKYMETLEAKYNQFVNTLKELAVQAGNAGLMDLAKNALDLATNLNQTVKSVGGLETVLKSLLGLIIIVKSKSIAKGVVETGQAIKSVSETVQIAGLYFLDYCKAVKSADGITGKFSTTTSALSKIPLAGWISIVTAAITALSVATTAYNQKIEEQNKAAIKSGQESESQAKKLVELSAKYEHLSQIQNRSIEQNKEFVNVIAEMQTVLGKDANELSGLTAGTEEYAKALDKIVDKNLATTITQMTSASEALGKQLTAAAKTDTFFGMGKSVQGIEGIAKSKDDLQEYERIVSSIMSEFKQTAANNLSGESSVFYAPTPDDVQSTVNYYSALKESQAAMDAAGASMDENERKQLVNSELYRQVTAEIERLSEAFNQYLDSQVRVAAYNDIMSNGLPQTNEEMQALTDRVMTATGANEQFRDIVSEIVGSLFPQFSSEVSAASSEVENHTTLQERLAEAYQQSADAVKDLNQSVDDLQAAYSTLTQAQEEWNTSGMLSIDTLQSLISLKPQYLQLLFDEEGQVHFNEEAFQNLALAELEEMRVAALRQQLDAISSITNEQEAINYLAGAYVNAKTEADALNQSLANQISLLVETGNVSVDTANKLSNVVAGINSLFDKTAAGIKSGGVFLGSSSKPKGGYSGGGGRRSGGGGGRKGPTKSWYDSQVETFERLNRMGQKTTKEVEDFYRAMTKSGKLSADERLKAEEKLFNAVKKNINETKKKEIEALKDQKEALKKSTDAQIKELNKQKDAIEKEAQAELDALDRVETEKNRAREMEDLYEDLESAKARSGKEARKAQYEAEKQIARKQEDYSLEDRREQIEANKEAQIEAIDQEIEALQEMSEAQAEAIDAQIDALNEKYSEQAVNMQAFSEINSDKLYDTYVDGFVSPMANGMADGFTQATQIMEGEATTNAANLSKIYDDGLFAPSKAKITDLMNQLKSVQQLPKTDFIGPMPWQYYKDHGVGLANRNPGSTSNKYNNLNITNYNNISNGVDEDAFLRRTERALAYNITNMP